MIKFFKSYILPSKRFQLFFVIDTKTISCDETGRRKFDKFYLNKHRVQFVSVLIQKLKQSRKPSSHF